jgi:hypothetical protein
MESQAEMKICPACAESIKALAKVCPFCRTKQHRFALLARELGVILPMIGLIALAGALLSVIVPEDSPKGRRFSWHRNALVVRTHKVEHIAKVVSFSPGGGNSSSDGFSKQSSTNFQDRFTGLVTNQNGIPWRVKEFEIRYLNQKGETVDVAHERVSEPFVVQPHSEHALSLERAGRIIDPPNSVKIRVSNALDGDVPDYPD